MPREHSLLIVENDASLLDLLTRNFIQRGYAVTPVGHPRQALEAATVKSFDVALLDGSLPEHDGIWLTRELKLHVAHLQVIILSAHSDADFQAKCIDNGAFACLRKPCGLSALESTLERAIDERLTIGQTTGGQRPFVRTLFPLLLIGLLTLIMACFQASNSLQALAARSEGASSGPNEMTVTPASQVKDAVCVIRPTGDSGVSGGLHLVKQGRETEIPSAA